MSQIKSLSRFYGSSQKITSISGGIEFSIIGLWLILRVAFSAWAAGVSVASSLTEIEQAIDLWPPASPMMLWLERVLLAPWLRWDSVWYTRIVTEGYSLENGTAQFHPLYPLISALFYHLGLHPVASLLLVSSLSGILALLLFVRLAEMDLDNDTVKTSTVLFLLTPIAFILFAPYAEGLFLIWALLCLLFARYKKWWWAGLAGALAVLTRQQGIFLIIPLAWEIWESRRQNISQVRRPAWKDWFSVAVIPLGFLVWILYRATSLGDLQPNLNNLQSAIYSIIISPSADRVVPNQSFIWPWEALWMAGIKLWSTPDVDIVINLVLAVFFVVLLMIVWPKMRMSYKLYALTITLVSFSYQTGSFHPYMGLPRHLFLAIPVYLYLGDIVRKPRHRIFFAGFSMLGAFLLLLQYVFEGWVP